MFYKDDEEPKDLAVTLTCIFSKAMTTADGGWRISFDVSHDEGELVSQIARMSGVKLQMALVPFSD